MKPESGPPSAQGEISTRRILAGLTVLFLALAALFYADLWGQQAARRKIAPVDAAVLDPKPWRQSYADLIRAKEDLSDFACYDCHDRRKPSQLKLDEQHNVIIPQEHENITMGHGAHNRNNLCYNCHNETNLLALQPRDGRELKLQDSTPLCGSCHGPTYGDWEAGAHGRTSGYWSRRHGDIQRLDCVNCHDPHAPKIPSLQPAPGPHPLHEPPPAPPRPHAAP